MLRTAASRIASAASAALLRRSQPAATAPLTSNVRCYSDSKDTDTDKEVKKEDTGPPLVLVERDLDLHVMSIGINRPEKRNCVDDATSDELERAFEEFDDDDEMHCAVLHGVGGNFCAGYDLDYLSTFDEEELPNRMAKFLERGPMGPTRMEMNKPVIAAVGGWAVAGGLELALMCDLRVVEESARMGVLCRRFGVPLVDGGTVRLPELIGLSRALDLIITGRIIEAKEALDFGIANRLVANGTAYGQAMNMAREIVKFPQACLRADRRSAYFATFASKSLEQSLNNEIENSIHVVSAESIKGAKKFNYSGLGKHGKFNVNEPANREQWEDEYDAIEKAEKEKKKKKKKDDNDD